MDGGFRLLEDQIICFLIDFHRWTVAGPEWKYVPPSEKDKRTLFERLGGKVLVVIVDHKDKAGNIYGTVTHNRARGTHLLEPMKKNRQRAHGRGQVGRRNRQAAWHETGGNIPFIRVFQGGLLENDGTGEEKLFQSGIYNEDIMIKREIFVIAGSVSASPFSCTHETISKLMGGR